MKKTLLFLAVLAFAAASSAMAGTTVMTFEGLGCTEPVMNYYDGGFGGFGSGPGPNYGVTWSSNSLALQESTATGGACSGNFINEPSPISVLFFLSGTGDVMDVPAGITTGFSFFYSGNSAIGNGSIDIYSGLDGTGTLLASFTADTSLTPLCTTGPNYCVWQPDGVAFNGTAESVVFGGAANFIGWDNITLGSSVPVGTPEPASLALLGTAMLGAGLLLRKQVS